MISICLQGLSLGLACFLGMGALMEALPWLQKIILGGGGVLVIYIGSGLIRSKADLSGGKNVERPLWKIAGSAFVVTWLNPQALIDGTLPPFLALPRNNPIQQLFLLFA